MTEQEGAYLLADKLLDEPNADPDDDLRTLARQLLRHKERAEFGVEAWADCVVCVTLVGVSDNGLSQPTEHGNCFSVAVEGQETRVVNFNHENLEKLLAMGMTWPIRCRRLGGVAVIHDERIGSRWYADGYCELCCPKELLPLPQLHRQEREVRIGRREEGNGMVCIKMGVKAQFE